MSLKKQLTKAKKEKKWIKKFTFKASICLYSSNSMIADMQLQHYRTITAVNKLITIMYKYFIASHVGHIEFLIASFP